MSDVTALTRPPSAPPSSVAGRWSRLRSPLVAAGGVAAVCVATWLRDPNVAGSWLTCPFLLTTGFYCPGCGTLRALHALLGGDVATAWAFNPGLLAALPLFFVVWVTAVRRAWLGVPRVWTPPARLLNVLPVVIAGYWILRNVPGFEFLGPPR
ncbi:DUF2752 domain-containing protein [Propioniciclava sp.]|uniref:DUF2752 domain-containing protein n=1 Tax=Propioniciclava sp. TaxID=2038686 RepID=UPI00262C8191|nr:DUF2752 domain-containing protein [Propioniciclava sp.]